MADVRLIWVETSILPEGIGIKAHTHDYCHLYYVVHGTCNFVIQNKHHVVKEGDIVIAMPGILHELKATDHSIKLLEIKFAATNASLLGDLSKIAFPINADAHADYFIHTIVDHGRSRLDYFIHSTQVYLNTLLIHLTSGFHIPDLIASNSQLIDTTGFSKVTTNIVIYIEENYMNNVTLDMLAREFDYNKHYLCVAFKKDTGITIIDYLNFVRIRHAAEMFSYNDLDLPTVCTRVGFTNLSHFNNTFKKLTGMPPGHYRRMFPVDVNGNLREGGFIPGNNEDQIQKISEIFGTLPNE